MSFKLADSSIALLVDGGGVLETAAVVTVVVVVQQDAIFGFFSMMLQRCFHVLLMCLEFVSEFYAVQARQTTKNTFVSVQYSRWPVELLETSPIHVTPTDMVV